MPVILASQETGIRRIVVRSQPRQNRSVRPYLGKIHHRKGLVEWLKEVRISDIHLGNNCPVSRMWAFNSVVSYPVTYSRINKLIFQGNIFILSEVNYRPMLNITHTFQVFCFLKRLKLLSLLPFGMNKYDINNHSISDSSQVTKEGQQPSASSQSKM
jgi:hypothetical protein